MKALLEAQVYLSLGTNIGNRKMNLMEAVTSIKKNFSNFSISRIYETIPLYIKDQPQFLNCVVRGETTKTPIELLDFVQNIEQKMGRDRKNVVNKGPRIIDIDILLYHDEIISTDRLHIPHPGIYERQFVLVPLLELEPEIKDPKTGYPFSIFLDKLENQGISVYAGKDL
ncbi:MAG: 2-amino-4-hydroxy-6-hydroxymethyldihydropteridine diphosphokinase [Spirochaetales bacterium]|nr:2-amino-4-hydroxy-6-hydroxymethyldihydropteridine diphosphokinase [Spirochaetales bacterium]